MLPACSVTGSRGIQLKQALVTMLSMQNSMNTRVHPDWINQRFEWYRAIWIECGELMEHYGYKWWKKQQPDMAQVRLEVIDIWHFGLSALFDDERDVEQIAQDIIVDLESQVSVVTGVREATERLALHALETRHFSPALFRDLMLSVQLDFDSLYSAYVGKNVLNFFRQDHGYQEGTYRKNWQGREDNEHLVELVAELDHGASDFAEQVYQALARRYDEAGAG
jgi:dimeric dUTPase (all-alpha-NTP-PPase superfamily)